MHFYTNYTAVPLDNKLIFPLLLSIDYSILVLKNFLFQANLDDNKNTPVKGSSTSSNAKNILRNKRGDVINLFTIIKDSIKLARDTYNRYSASN